MFSVSSRESVSSQVFSESGFKHPALFHIPISDTDNSINSNTGTEWKASHRKELQYLIDKKERTETELGAAVTHADLLEFQCTHNQEHLH